MAVKLTNLNIFLARFLLYMMFVGGIFALGVSMFLSSVDVGAAAIKYVAFPAAALILAGAVVLDGRKRGFSPINRREDRKTRYKIGHILVAAANTAVIVTVGFGAALAQMTHNSDYRVLSLYALASIVPYAIGLRLVDSSRA
jgi:hypothetical protein